jgi:hypothetical protein
MTQYAPRSIGPYATVGSKFFYSAQKALFTVSNPTPVQLSAGLATTFVGLCLSNPAASTKNLAIQRVSGMTMVAPAAFLALGLITGFVAGGITVHTTPLTPLSGFVGDSGVPVGKADSAATLVGTPAWALWFVTEAATAGNPMFNVDLAGSIIIPPGGYAAIGANVAGPAAGFLGSMEWVEAPIV